MRYKLNFIIFTVLFLFITVYLSQIKICHAMRFVPDDVIVHPVLVTLMEGSNATGSGFYFHDEEKGIFLVSACHVFMKGDKKGLPVLRGNKAHLLSYPKDLDWSNPAKLELDLNYLLVNKFIQYDVKNDVIIIQISKKETIDDKQRSMKINAGIKRLRKGRFLTVPLKNTKTYKDVLIGNEVYISGFPASIGIEDFPQIDYQKPLLRKGIVAGKYDKRMTIIIDCPTYGGNSGGPVIELEVVDITTTSVRVIGIISQFVPFVEQWVNLQHGLINKEFENSGYTVVVPMDKIIELVEKF